MDVGLKEGDRIVEVNGVGVADESHAELFARIKAVDDRVQLLVIDPAAEQHYRRRDVAVDGRMKHVMHVTCPDDNPATAPTATATPPPTFYGMALTIMYLSWLL